MSDIQPYRLFNVRLLRKNYVSPSLLSLVFSGPEVAQMKREAPDQRIKILFPSEDGTPPGLPTEGHWSRLLQEIPKPRRPIVRTYTLRHCSPTRHELTVEFVNHGTKGPASAWAIHAQPGDALQIVAPDAAYPGLSGGYEWSAPAGLQHALIIADETALPAARGILELLALQTTPPKVQVFLEVPEQGDCLDLSHFTFAEIFWLPRQPFGLAHGEYLIEAVKQHAVLPQNCHHKTVLTQIEGEHLWHKAVSDNSEFYGWVAAESTVVKQLRRYLTAQCGVDPDVFNFMAYWAKGRVR
ncbi:siderophore-interacting protein [Enterobacteriaceae bacterium 4M9]|nr:siderophore-interacting protein [Enterobacteriaceae bacterium 4M9]